MHVQAHLIYAPRKFETQLTGVVSTKCFKSNADVHDLPWMYWVIVRVTVAFQSAGTSQAIHFQPPSTRNQDGVFFVFKIFLHDQQFHSDILKLAHPTQTCMPQ